MEDIDVNIICHINKHFVLKLFLITHCSEKILTNTENDIGGEDILLEVYL